MPSLWIDCQRCEGAGTVSVPVPLRGGRVLARELACPECRQWAGVLVPVLCEPWKPGRVLNPKAGTVEEFPR